MIIWLFRPCKPYTLTNLITWTTLTTRATLTTWTSLTTWTTWSPLTTWSTWTTLITQETMTIWTKLDHLDHLDHMDHQKTWPTEPLWQPWVIERFIMKINAEPALFTWSCCYMIGLTFNMLYQHKAAWSECTTWMSHNSRWRRVEPSKYWPTTKQVDNSHHIHLSVGIWELHLFVIKRFPSWRDSANMGLQNIVI